MGEETCVARDGKGNMKGMWKASEWESEKVGEWEREKVGTLTPRPSLRKLRRGKPALSHSLRRRGSAASPMGEGEGTDVGGAKGTSTVGATAPHPLPSDGRGIKGEGSLIWRGSDV